MHRTRIKICGICRPEDGILAASLGVDAIGIIRVASAGRYVERDAARAIVQALPPFVTPVLLHVNATADHIRADLAALPRPAMVQMNGDESPDLIAGPQIIKAIRVDADLPGTLALWESAAAIVLESPGQTGGSGVPNDWSAVVRFIESGVFDSAPPLMAAGGLTPETVGDVIRSVRPFMVDVSSGVERIKRQKDSGLLRDFVAAVRAADDSLAH